MKLLLLVRHQSHGCVSFCGTIEQANKNKVFPEIKLKLHQLHNMTHICIKIKNGFHYGAINIYRNYGSLPIKQQYYVDRNTFTFATGLYYTLT